jgi:N-dimethylarginine dimethylaminohydrolase
MIKPTTFEILSSQKGQNIYIVSPDPKQTIMKQASKQFSNLVKHVKDAVVYEIQGNPTLPDIVFTANGGFRVWGTPLVILPQMKYKQRKDELPYLKEIFEDLGLQTLEFPSSEPFEGQAEAKWFHGGKLLICGYGYRATKKAFDLLGRMLHDVYRGSPPVLVTLPLDSPDYYHLDMAMLQFGDSCIVHKRAFSLDSIKILKKVLGSSNVHIIDTDDAFCLNAVVQGGQLLTHKISNSVKNTLESITGLDVVQNDTSVFERSGGSVRCMICDL